MGRDGCFSVKLDKGGSKDLLLEAEA